MMILQLWIMSSEHAEAFHPNIFETSDHGLNHKVDLESYLGPSVMVQLKSINPKQDMRY